MEKHSGRWPKLKTIVGGKEHKNEFFSGPLTSLENNIFFLDSAKGVLFLLEALTETIDEGSLFLFLTFLGIGDANWMYSLPIIDKNRKQNSSMSTKLTLPNCSRTTKEEEILQNLPISVETKKSKLKAGDLDITADKNLNLE